MPPLRVLCQRGVIQQLCNEVLPMQLRANEQEDDKEGFLHDERSEDWKELYSLQTV